mmetsp:Transcript_64266/g.186317  ORF Transcript_64266/g.186317 Transcript_64266/m.186317 type:complete len:107 (-) Transcript_64266:45-365(-)
MGRLRAAFSATFWGTIRCTITTELLSGESLVDHFTLRPRTTSCGRFRVLVGRGPASFLNPEVHDAGYVFSHLHSGVGLEQFVGEVSFLHLHEGVTLVLELFRIDAV